MTAELEAVVVAAYVFADEYRPLARRGPCDPPSANRCSMVSRIPNLARRRVAVHTPLRPASDSRLASAGDDDLRRGFLDPRPHPLPSLPGQGSLQSTRSRAPQWLLSQATRDASALGPPCPLISSEPLWLIAGVVEPGCDVGTDAELSDDLEPFVTGDHFFDLEVGMLVSDRKLCRVRAKGLVLAVREFKSPRADLVGAFAHDDQCVRVGGFELLEPLVELTEECFVRRHPLFAECRDLLGGWRAHGGSHFEHPRELREVGDGTVREGTQYRGVVVRREPELVRVGINCATQPVGETAGARFLQCNNKLRNRAAGQSQLAVTDQATIVRRCGPPTSSSGDAL